jgi:ribosome modulation factor
MTNTNKRKARDAGYRARYQDRPRDGNPFPATEAWASLRGAWYDGWDTANGEVK